MVEDDIIERDTKPVWGPGSALATDCSKSQGPRVTSLKIDGCGMQKFFGSMLSEDKPLIK